MNKFVSLIDGNHLAARSFFALNLSDSKGRGTSAIYGVVDMLNTYLQEKQPDGLIVCWDFGKSENRRQVYSDYKCRRAPANEEEAKKIADRCNQMNVCKEILKTLGIPQVQKWQYEGDELLYATSLVVSTIKDYKSVIVTSDKDLLQVVDSQTIWYDPIKDKYVRIDNFEQEIGIPKSKFLLRKCLMGDDGDDVPGIPKIGEKRAFNLAMKYNTLEEIASNTGITKEEQLARGHLEEMLRNKRLVDLKEFITPEIVEEVRNRIKEPLELDVFKLEEIFKDYEFASFLANLETVVEPYKELMQKNKDLQSKLNYDKSNRGDVSQA